MAKTKTKKTKPAQKKKKTIKKKISSSKRTPKKPVPKKKKTTVKKKATKPAASKKPQKKQSKLTSREKKVMDIKKNLLMQRDSLLKEAEEALNSLPGEINFPDMGDQATAETDRNFMLRLRDRERMLLKKIDEAIEGIDNGTFGICEECSSPIDIKRLEARPVTTLCIECKTRQEEEERISAGG
jgi:DnaK suppressor protein